MASGSHSPRDFVLPRWIRPVRRCWKLLTWVWGVLLAGVFINIVSSLLTAKNLDLRGTPLGWGVDHLWITFPPLLLLVLLTLLARLASLQEQEYTVSPTFPLNLTQRQQFLREFQQEYSSRLDSSLQGKVTLELHLQERTDVITSPASLVFRNLETGEVSTLPQGTSIIQAYDRLQRSILILGEPGSGKTTLLLRLALELLQRAENDLEQPLAIILNLTSWARTQRPLVQWLSEECLLVHRISKHLTATLIAKDQVQFLLDGLDEMGDPARTACIDAINTYRQAHRVPLVVCSRSQEYKSQPAHLILPGAVEIQPLEPAQVSRVLKQAGKSLAAVRAGLRSNDNLRDLLTTPLMLSIVILTYRDKTLKELPQRGSPEEQQRAIFEQYVQRMLQRYQQQRSFSQAQTIATLAWLAQQMQQRNLTGFHLESLQADWLSTRWARITYRLVIVLVYGLLVGLVFGLVGGLGGGLVGVLVGVLVVWPVFGLVFGLVRGLVAWLTDIKPAEKFAWSWKRSTKGFFFGLFYGICGGFLVGWARGMLGELLGELRCCVLTINLNDVLFFGLLVGPTYGLLSGLSGSTPLTSQQPLSLSRKPNQGIHTSGWNALLLGLIFFSVGWLLVGLLVGLGGGLRELVIGLGGGLGGGLGSGLVFGLVGGLVFGLVGGLLVGRAYFQHYVLRLFLAQGRTLPWRTVSFLEEAKACNLLKRESGGYKFVHAQLQEYFASLPLPLTT